MPNTSGTLPSGSSLRVKKSFLNKPLTEDAAKDLGISKYYKRYKLFCVKFKSMECKRLTHILQTSVFIETTLYYSVCKALENILHNLDSQVGRSLMKNNPQCLNKDPYDMIT